MAAGLSKDVAGRALLKDVGLVMNFIGVRVWHTLGGQAMVVVPRWTNGFSSIPSLQSDSNGLSDLREIVTTSNNTWNSKESKRVFKVW